MCHVCSAPHWDQFHQVWSQSTHLFLTYNICIDDTLRHAVNLPFDPLTLNVFSASAQLSHDQTLYQISAKSDSSKLSYWWLNKVSCPFLGPFCSGYFSESPNLGDHIGLLYSMLSTTLFRYLTRCSVSKLEGIKGKAKFCTFWHPSKIRGWIGEISESMFRQLIYAPKKHVLDLR